MGTMVGGMEMGTRTVPVKSDFLFAQPGILFGLSRFFDFAGVFDSYNESRNGREADARAAYADWHITEADLGLVLEKVSKDPSSCREESNQLSLFPEGSKSERAREIQETP
jgi:hypothetical protein